MSKRNDFLKRRENVQIVIYFAAITVLITWLTIGMGQQSITFEWQAVLVMAMLLFAFIILIHPLLRKSRTPWWVWLIMAIGFFFVAFALIAFCSVMPPQYKDSTIAIISSCVGGFFALYGIGLTIKHGRLQKEEDDLEKAKPNVFVVSNEKLNAKDGLTKNNICPDINISLSTLKPAKDQKDFYSFAPFSLANSDLAMCTFQGVTINNSLAIVFQYDNVLLKGSKNRLTVDYDFDLEEDLQSIELVLGDMLGNLYSCNVSFNTKTSGKKKKKTTISILGVCGLAPIDEKLAKSFQAKNAPVEK